MNLARASLVLAVTLSFACKKEVVASDDAAPVQMTTAPVAKLDAVPRKDFNRLAAELSLPIFWSEDANKNNALDADELVVYWGLAPGAVLGEYVTVAETPTPIAVGDATPAAPVDAGPKPLVFTQKMHDAYDQMVKRHREGATNPPGLDQKEIARRDAVLKELAQGKATLLFTDLSKATSEEKRFVGFVMKAAEYIEQLYAKQLGTSELASKIPENDPASKTLFFRSQGPSCGSALLVKDSAFAAACSAVPDAPKGPLSGMYPPEMLAKPKFCDELSKNKDKTVMDPFTVVQGDLKTPKGVPFIDVFKTDMERISGQLKAAAEALGDKEAALKAYLLADAQAFIDNKWWPADEAWAKMDSKNSKFYLRIAPDENYREPCDSKALFHVSFGLINQGSLKWSSRVEPFKTEMEKALADLAGPPYKQRDVTFKLPDFMDVALNAGDSRTEFRITIGQSLPNYGPVANEGRGRTVAMTNPYTDPDSLAQSVETTKSLLCSDTMPKFSTEQDPMLMSTVLHEAAHNLGPAHQYKAKGKIDREIFGGANASMLEELKAQTAALYFTDWLAEKQTISREEATKAHVRDVVWAFGHIMFGMTGEDQAYARLSAIQVGWLMKDGALTWRADETAANGTDKGCFSIATDKIPASVKSLMTTVAQIKGRGDKTAADKLVKDFVDVTGDKKKVHEVITERLTRFPKQSFVYSIKLD
jgi:hypothetical protein